MFAIDLQIFKLLHRLHIESFRKCGGDGDDAASAVACGRAVVARRPRPLVWRPLRRKRRYLVRWSLLTGPEKVVYFEI